MHSLHEHVTRSMEDCGPRCSVTTPQLGPDYQEMQVGYACLKRIGKWGCAMAWIDSPLVRSLESISSNGCTGVVYPREVSPNSKLNLFPVDLPWTTFIV
jgi:hypothetical protein